MAGETLRRVGLGQLGGGPPTEEGEPEPDAPSNPTMFPSAYGLTFTVDGATGSLWFVLSAIIGPRREVIMSTKGAAGTGTLVQLSSRGQVTLPSGVRRDLGLRPGDAMVVAVQDGRVVLEPVEVLPLERYTDERIQEFKAAAELSVEELEEARVMWLNASTEP